MSPKKQLRRKQDASGQGKPTETIVPAPESSAMVQGQLILDQEQCEEVIQMASEDAGLEFALFKLKQAMVNLQATFTACPQAAQRLWRLLGQKSTRTPLPKMISSNKKVAYMYRKAIHTKIDAILHRAKEIKQTHQH